MPKKVVVSGVLLWIPLDIKSVPEHMAEQWERTQKNVIDLTEIKRDKVIPHEPAYMDKMVGPSSRKFAGFVSPGFVSRAGKNRDEIIASQHKNISKGYKKYCKSLELLRATVDGVPAKRAKDKISAMRSVYSKRMAETTLPFTGEKTVGKSVCSIAPQWLTGEQKVMGLIRGADRVTAGGPVDVIKPGLSGALRAAMSSQLLKCGAKIVQNDFQQNVINKQNDIINSIIRGLQDDVKYAPFTPGGESHCDYIIGESAQLLLEIQVTEIKQ
jgi:hypothetical protein